MAVEAAGAGSQPEAAAQEATAAGAPVPVGLPAQEPTEMTTAPVGAIKLMGKQPDVQRDSTAAECSPFSQLVSRNGLSALSEPSLAGATPVEKAPAEASATPTNGKNPPGQVPVQDPAGVDLRAGVPGAPVMSKVVTTIADTPTEARGMHQMMDAPSKPTGPTRCATTAPLSGRGAPKQGTNASRGGEADPPAAIEPEFPAEITRELPMDATPTDGFDGNRSGKGIISLATAKEATVDAVPAGAPTATRSTRSRGGRTEAGDAEVSKLGNTKTQSGKQVNGRAVPTRSGRAAVSHASVTEPASVTRPARSTRSGAQVRASTRTVSTVTMVNLLQCGARGNAEGLEGTPTVGRSGGMTRRGPAPAGQGEDAGEVQTKGTPGGHPGREKRSKGAHSEHSGTAAKPHPYDASDGGGGKTRRKRRHAEEGPSAGKDQQEGAKPAGRPLAEEQGKKTRSNRGPLQEAIATAVGAPVSTVVRKSKNKVPPAEEGKALEVEAVGPTSVEPPAEGKGGVTRCKDAIAPEGELRAKPQGEVPQVDVPAGKAREGGRRPGKRKDTFTTDSPQKPVDGPYASISGAAVNIFGAAAEVPLLACSQGALASLDPGMPVPVTWEEGDHQEYDPFPGQGGDDNGVDSPIADSEMLEAARHVGALIPSGLSGGSSWQDTSNGTRGVYTTTPGSVLGAANIPWCRPRSCKLTPKAPALATDAEPQNEPDAEMRDVDTEELPIEVPLVSEVGLKFSH
jgi:hypothetical protein